MFVRDVTAQTEWKLVLEGSVSHQGETETPIEKAKIVVKNEGSKYGVFKTNEKGEFKIDLAPDGDYLLVFSSKKMVSKRLQFNTYNVPEQAAEGGDWLFRFDVGLFEKEKGVDYSILDEPLAKIYFSEESYDFEYDMEYTKARMEELKKFRNQ